MTIEPADATSEPTAPIETSAWPRAMVYPPPCRDLSRREWKATISKPEPCYFSRSKALFRGQERGSATASGIFEAFCGRSSRLGNGQGLTATARHSGFSVGVWSLDGLIANTDRHEESWSVIRDAGGRIRLCASDDHATSLGSNLADAQRERLLDDPSRFAAWLRRGTANRFEGGRRVTPAAHAVSGITLAPNWARSWWVNSLEALDLGALRTLLDTADPPSLSEPARTFAIELIEANRRRLLDEFDGP